MFGIAVVTHGNMSEGIADSLKVIMGSNEALKTFTLYEDDDIKELGTKIETFIKDNQDKNGVFIFTDLQDASPYNQALLTINNIEDIDKEKVYVVSGVNLPLIIEVVNHNMLGSSLEDTVSNLKKRAQDSIHFQQVLGNEDIDDEDDGF